jgi:hypothetical protein
MKREGEKLAKEFEKEIKNNTQKMRNIEHKKEVI